MYIDISVCKACEMHGKEDQSRKRKEALKGGNWPRNTIPRLLRVSIATRIGKKRYYASDVSNFNKTKTG